MQLVPIADILPQPTDHLPAKPPPRAALIEAAGWIVASGIETPSFIGMSRLHELLAKEGIEGG
jgi:hypothetical protein